LPWRDQFRRAFARAAAVLVLSVLVVGGYWALRPNNPFLKHDGPLSKVVVAPPGSIGIAMAKAAASVPGAKPSVVLIVGNVAFVGLDPRAGGQSEARVAGAVRRSVGPWPSDEARVNDPTSRAIAKVYVTADAEVVTGLTNAARRLLAGEPLAAVLPDLLPFILRVNGLKPPPALKP